MLNFVLKFRCTKINSDLSKCGTKGLSNCAHGGHTELKKPCRDETWSVLFPTRSSAHSGADVKWVCCDLFGVCGFPLLERNQVTGACRSGLEVTSRRLSGCFEEGKIS